MTITITLLFASFLVLMLIGTPVAVALGGATVIASLWAGALPLPILGQKIYGNLDHFTLMAVPFFFLAAACPTSACVRQIGVLD